MKPFDESQGKFFAEQTKAKFFLGSTAGNHYKFKLSNRVNQIFPGIYSTDPMQMLLCSQIIKEVEKLNIDKVVYDNGFFDYNAKTTDFRELNTISGFNMNPATYSVIDNALMRSNMFLNKDFESIRDREIFKEFMKERYAHHDGSAGKISRISSSVFPFFSKNMELKVDHLSLILEKGAEVLDLLVAGKLDECYSKYYVLLAMIDVYRSQSDSFVQQNDGTYKSKDREVNDIAYAISGGSSGKRFVADKSIMLNGRLVQDKAAMRARTAYGVSNSINTMFTSAFEGFRHWSDNEFEMTYKHRSRKEIEHKINLFDNALPVDVTQYDQSIPLYLIEEWIKLSPFNDKAKRVITMLFNAPMLYRGVSESADPYWTGDPLKQDFFNQFKGLISGLFCTSAVGKDLFTYCSLTMLDRCYGDVLTNVNKILKWKHPVYAISNMGDDTNIHFNGNKFGIWAKSMLDNTKYGLSPYFKVDLEDGFKFLGNVGYIGKDGRKHLCGDIGTYLSKMLVPERSIGTKEARAKNKNIHRKYGVYGLLSRREAYADHPLFGQIDEIFQRSFRDIYKVDWFKFMNEHLELPESDQINVRSQADLEVMMNPDKLHYKYSYDDISDSVIDTVEQKISERNTELAYNLLIK